MNSMRTIRNLFNVIFKILSLTIFLLMVGTGNLAIAKTVTKIIEYKDGDVTLEGVLAYNDSNKKMGPGVIVVHEWMGLNDYAIMRAKQLAEMGYTAFAADIYGKGIRPKTPAEAGELSKKYKTDRPLLRQRVTAALDVLRGQKNVDKSRIAAIGYCFGGTTVLELARAGADVAGVVSFHGGLDTPTPQDAKNIKGKVLVLHGAVDPNVPAEQVAGFMKEMNDAKTDYQFVAYANTVHAFTNPASGNDMSKGAAYNELADKRSFIAMKDFFNEIFKK